MIRILILVLGCLLTLICTVSLEFSDFTEAGDPSWSRVLALAFEKGWAFGQDVVFTHGPLGFVMFPAWNPSVSLAYWSWRSFFSLAIFGGFWVLLRPLTSQKATGLLWLLTVFVLLLPISISPDSIFYFLIIEAAWVGTLIVKNPRTLGRSSPLLISVALVLAAVSLIKFGFLLLSAFSLLSLASGFYRRSRKAEFQILTIGYILFFLALWRLLGQSLDHLPGYLLTSWELAAGFADSMSIAGNSVEPTLFFVIGLSLSALLWVSPLPRIAVLIWTAALFLVYKASFVRHDGHALIGASFLMGYSVLWIGFLAPMRERAERFACAFTLLLSTLYLALSIRIHLGYGNPAAWVGNQISVYVGRTKAFYHSEEFFRSRNLALQESQMRLNQTSGLDGLKGTADLYGYQQGLLLASSLQYQPRPIFQSYTAYTPRLLALNADHLKAEKSPDTLIWMMSPIDQRYPPLEDSSSWPEILSRYELGTEDKNQPDRVILKKRTHPLSINRMVLPLQTPNLSGEYVLPPAESTQGLIWAEIQIRKTLRGQITSQLLRPQPVHGTFIFDNGETLSFRLPTPLLGAGFLLSPAVLTATDFRTLIKSVGIALSTPPPLRKVRKIVIHADPSHWQVPWEIQLSKLNFE